jgi:hypothetical protein
LKKKMKMHKMGKMGKKDKKDKMGKGKMDPAPSPPVCSLGQDPELEEMVKESIFDPPTDEEMAKIATAMSMFDFSEEGPDIVLSPAPLAGPDRTGPPLRNSSMVTLWPPSCCRVCRPFGVAL